VRPFVFRLERVRRLRVAEEEALRRDLARVYADLAALDVRRGELERALQASMLEGGSRPGAERWRLLTREKAAELDVREEGLCLDAARVLARLEVVHGRVRALDRLEERRREQHRRERRSAEAAARDDVRPRRAP
jgi:flagellar biosynthesis chaperone FliJ